MPITLELSRAQNPDHVIIIVVIIKILKLGNHTSILTEKATVCGEIETYQGY